MNKSSGDPIYGVAAFLAPAHFADPVHGRIYAALVRRIEAGQHVDAIALKPEFAGSLAEVGGTAYLSHLAADRADDVDVAEYGQLIRTLADERAAPGI